MAGFKTDGYNPQFDGVRAFAVAGVLYAHYVDAFSVLGHLGVRMFFMLSSFLITGILLRVKESPSFRAGFALKSFYAHRVLRIIPAYYGMLIFFAVTNPQGIRSELFWQFSFLSNFRYAAIGAWEPWVFSHTWTLAIEWQFYLVWPLVVLGVSRDRLVQICLGLLAVSLLYRLGWFFAPASHAAQDLLPVASFDVLGTGALLALRPRVGGAYFPQGSGLGLACVAAIACLAWIEPWGAVLGMRAHWIAEETVPLLPMALILLAAMRGGSGPLGRLLSLAPVVGLGRISYGVYLYHFPILFIGLRLADVLLSGIGDAGYGRFVVFTAVTILVSWVSWKWFETPILAFKRHFPFLPASARNIARSRAKA